MQQHLCMKATNCIVVLFLFAIQMVLAFAKLQRLKPWRYYIPGKEAYSKCHQVTQLGFPAAQKIFVLRLYPCPSFQVILITLQLWK